MTIIKDDIVMYAGELVQVLTIMEPITSCKEKLAYIIGIQNGVHNICAVTELTPIVASTPV